MSASDRWVRCIVLISKKDGMSQEEFDKHWLEIHGTIAKNYPNVVRYSQLHLTGQATVGDMKGTSDVPVDGIVDFIYTARDDIPKIWESPAGLEGLADSPKFLGAVTEFYVEEIVITDHLGIGKLTDRELETEPLRWP